MVELKAAVEEASAADDMNRAAEAKEQQQTAEIALGEARAAWNAELDASPVVIDVPQIADIVSVTSGVPVSSLTEDESRRLLVCERAQDAHHRAGRGGRRRREGDPAQPQPAQGPPSPWRFLHLFGPHGYRQD